MLFHGQYKVLVLTYEALYVLGPGYLKDHLFQYNLVCALHSSEEALLCVPLAHGSPTARHEHEGLLGGGPSLLQ